MRCRLGLGVVMVAAGAVWGQVATQPAPVPEAHGVTAPTTLPVPGPTVKIRFPLTQPAPRDASNVAPTLLTLHHEGVHPIDVWLEVFKQVGAPVRFNELGDPVINPVTVHMERRPYWEAVEELQKATGANVGVGMEGKASVSFRRQIVAPARPGPPTAYVSGAFKVDRGPGRRVLKFGAAAAPQSDCEVELLVTPEPGLALKSIVAEAAPEVAVDEKGLSLLPAKAPGVLPYFYPLRLSQYRFLVKLSPTAEAGEKIAKLQGTLHASVPGEYVPMTFTDEEWAKQEFEHNHVNVKLSVTPEGERWLVSLRSEWSKDRPASFWQEHDALLRSTRLSLVDAGGVKFTEVPRNGGPLDARQPWLDVRFQRDAWPVDALAARVMAPAETRPAEKPVGPPKKVMMEIPAVFKDVAIRYEFADVPMP